MNESILDDSIFQRLHELISLRELGEWTADLHQELETMLLESNEVRRTYLSYMNDTATLHLRAHRVKEEAGVMADSVDDVVEPVRRAGRLWRFGAAVGWAAVFALAALLVWVFQSGSGNPDDFVMDPSGTRPLLPANEGVAVLARTVEAKWGDESQHGTGLALNPGKLVLTSGSVQIDFRSGASVILEGPAEFELISSLKARLYRGKLRADVPPQAKGFTVAVKDLDVVDYGTEFGLSHDKDGNTEVHVIKGEVRVRGVGTHAALVEKKLITGQGLLIRTTGMLDLFMADAGAFISRAKIAYLQHLEAQKQYDQWLQHSDRLAHDSDLILYYTFEDQKPWDQTLLNRAAQRPKGTDGAIIGCRWVEGRWPGKGALDFKQSGDRVRINVPDECQSLTMSTWVRFDGFDRYLSSLLLTDGWDRGEPHWQVSWDGELILGVFGSANSRQKGVLSQGDVGRWIHLASVYDAKSKTIRHYRDGRPLGSTRMWTALPLVIGSAQIGNWDPKQTQKDTLRNLNGRMDELAIFKRALSDQEIGKMYQAGRID